MKLREVRKRRNLSQSQLARLSGINVRMIQAYEQEVKDINKAQFITLLKLSIALTCSIENIISDPDLIELIKEYGY